MPANAVVGVVVPGSADGLSAVLEDLDDLALDELVAEHDARHVIPDDGGRHA